MCIRDSDYLVNWAQGTRALIPRPPDYPFLSWRYGGGPEARFLPIGAGAAQPRLPGATSVRGGADPARIRMVATEPKARPALARARPAPPAPGSDHDELDLADASSGSDSTESSS